MRNRNDNSHCSFMLRVVSMLSTILMKLSIAELFAEIPTDAGAFIALVVMSAFLGFIWVGSRSPKRGSEPRSGASEKGSRPPTRSGKNQDRERTAEG